MSDPTLTPTPQSSSGAELDGVEQPLEIEAIYDGGVFVPRALLALPPGTRVRVRVTPSSNSGVGTSDRPGNGGAADAARPRLLVSGPNMASGHVGVLERAPAVSNGLAVAMLAVAGALVSVAEYQFLKQRAFSWPAFLASIVAVVAFTVAIGGRGAPRSFASTSEEGAEDATASVSEPWHWRVPLLAVAALLALLTLEFLAAAPVLGGYNWLFFPWLVAIVFYLVAVAGPPRSLRVARPSLPDRAWFSWTSMTVAALALVALVLRGWRVDTIPPTLGGDEGSQGLEAMRVLDGSINNPFSTGWLGVPTMSFYFNAPTIAIFGNTSFALRVPWVFVGALTVLVTFCLVRRLQGEIVALATTALLATYHYHIHYSRLGSNQIADALFVALALLFFYRAYDLGKTLDWALCGVVVGVAQYFYAGARFTAIVIVAVTAFHFLRDRHDFWLRHRRGVLIMVGAALITGGPMIQYAIRFPNDYNARINEVGIFQNGWVEKERQARNQGTVLLLLDQIKRAALAFNAYPDRTTWYGSPKPLFDFAAGALFLLGLGYATLRLRERRLFAMVAWWWGAMLMGGALTENPPSSQRLITLAVPAVFFVALAVVQIGTVLTSDWTTSTVRQFAPYLAAVVLGLSIVSVKWYFVDYTPLRVYGNFNAVVATDLGKYARDHLGANTRIYFFGPPRMYSGFGTIPYLAPEVEGVDIKDPLVAPPPPDLAQPDKDAAFVFLPERRGELDLVRQTFPGGEVSEMPSPRGGDPLYILYRVPRARLDG